MYINRLTLEEIAQDLQNQIILGNFTECSRRAKLLYAKIKDALVSMEKRHYYANQFKYILENILSCEDPNKLVEEGPQRGLSEIDYLFNILEIFIRDLPERNCRHSEMLKLNSREDELQLERNVKALKNALHITKNNIVLFVR